jgi:hypothetical protein
VAAAAADRTETFPRDQRGYQTGPESITALGIGGTGRTLPMLVGQDSFTLGRADGCDLRVDMKHMASIHARIERLPHSRASIRVTNVSSGKNDIVPNGEVAEVEFEMRAGEWFTIGDGRFYAFNDEMQLARPTVVEVLGLRAYDAIHACLSAAVKDSTRPVLLIGEPGSDQLRLGRAIHQMSHRRHNGFWAASERPRLDSDTRQALRDACNGTVLVPLHQKGKLDTRFAAAVADPEAKLRLVVCARSHDKVEASLPVDAVREAKVIEIPPLRNRADEIPELLDKWFIGRRSSLRFKSLRDKLSEALLAYAWPENLQELREAADYLVMVSQYRSGRQAAKEAPVSRGQLRHWAEKLSVALEFPLVPNRT